MMMDSQTGPHRFNKSGQSYKIAGCSDSRHQAVLTLDPYYINWAVLSHHRPL